MSAYIVGKETLDRVITVLRDHAAALGYGAGEDDPLGRYDWNDWEAMAALGRDLWALNRAAVNFRYREDGEPPYYGRYEPVALSLAQGVKSLQCLLYQCAEGDIPQRPLYKALRRGEYFLLCRIVDGLPEYQAAEWG